MQYSNALLTSTLAIFPSVLSLPLHPRSSNSVKMTNKTPNPICYGFEMNPGSTAPVETTCSIGIPGVLVAGQSSRTFPLPSNFGGSITEVRINNLRGARHEFNFDNFGKTWYDVDYEFGLSDSTFGPENKMQREDGGPSLQGEQNVLAKANSVWGGVPNKSALLLQKAYFRGDAGRLTYVGNDKGAGPDVKYFLQMVARVQAYVDHGSVDGVGVQPGTPEDQMKQAADKFSWVVETTAMEITAY